MKNKGSILGILFLGLAIVLSGCGHKQMLAKDSKNLKFGVNAPSIKQLPDGTFVYKDKKYDGTDDMRFGF